MDEKILTGTLEQLLYFLNPKKMAGLAMKALKESTGALNLEVTRELAVRFSNLTRITTETKTTVTKRMTTEKPSRTRSTVNGRFSLTDVN